MGFIAFGSQTSPVSEPSERALASKKNEQHSVHLVETQSAAIVRPSTPRLTDAGCKHCFQRHLFQISASHAFNLLLIKTGPTHLSSFDPSISVKAQQQKKEKKRRAHTCDWPAGERLVFQLAAIRD